MRRNSTAAVALAMAAVFTGCTSGGAPTATKSMDPSQVAVAGGAPNRPSVVAPLDKRVRPDVMVVATKPLSKAQVDALYKLSAGFTTMRVETITLNSKRKVEVLGVDANRFRPFAPQGTAESTPVWTAVARGELIVAHEHARELKLVLGKPVSVGKVHVLPLRLGAIATTGLPEVAAIVNEQVADQLGLQKETGALLSAGIGDPAKLAKAVQNIVGKDARVELLSQPTDSPLAFLTGNRAARAFGAFSYRYHADGTIEPDTAWVRRNIVFQRLPLLGVIGCHRLMFPQLRAALNDVVKAGLSNKIYLFGGCYVPRFIESNPRRAVSLHTWGIAIDLNVRENMPGTRGRMDPRVVQIFKRWGFRWGGDWSPTDPMHFELGALLNL